MVGEASASVVLYWNGALANVAAGSVSNIWIWQRGLMMPTMLLRLGIEGGGMHHQAHAA